MNAIVTAGGEIAPDQPLYALARGGLKAMLEIAGKPMIQWVLDALSQSNSIEHVVVVGLPPETDLDCAYPMSILPDQGDNFSNIQAGAREVMRLAPHETHAVVVSGDIPALRAETVDWLTCQMKDPEVDIYYTLVERPAMESHFPGVKFNFHHLKDMQVCDGKIHCFRLEAAAEESPLWKRLVASRNSSLRKASVLGYDTMLFLMLRQLALKDAEATVSKRLGIKGRAVLSPYPEISMGIEKPVQLEMMREYLARRSEKHPASAE